MLRSQRSPLDCEKWPTRCGNVDRAKAARAKAAIKVAKSKSPTNKGYHRRRKRSKAAFDLEYLKSLLMNIRLKSLFTLDNFDFLSFGEKECLIRLLPACDQLWDQRGFPVLSAKALNNEFFAKACVEWCERLGEGEFQNDCMQGDATFKVKQFGTSDGVMSRLLDGSLANSPNVTTSSRRFYRRGRRSRSSGLARDDSESVTSGISSASSLPFQNDQMIHFPGHSRTDVCSCLCKETFSLNRCPALRDHNYCAPLSRICRCKFLKKSARNEFSACLRRNDECSTSSLDGASTNSLSTAKSERTKRRGRMSRLLKDFVVDGGYLFTRISGNDTAEDANRLRCGGDNKNLINSDAGGASCKKNGYSRISKKTLVIENGSIGCKNNSSNSSNRSQYRNRHSASVTSATSFETHFSSDCDILSSVGANGQQNVCSCALMDVLNRSVDSPSSDSNSKSCISQPALCLAKLKAADNFNGVACSHMLNVSHREKLKTDNGNSSFCYEQKRSFIKFIGIQKISAVDERRRKLENHVDSYSIDNNNVYQQNGKNLTQFVVSEVEKYLHSGLNTAYAGFYSSPDVRNHSEGSNHCQEFSDDRKSSDLDIREKEMSWTLTQEKEVSLNVTSFSNSTRSCKVDCTGEAVAQLNC